MGVSALVGGFSSATNAASDLNETINKSAVIFGDMGYEVYQWSEGAATSLGMSQSAALAAAAGFGDMFSQIGFGQKQAADMSQTVVQMAADLGSFSNLDTADVTDRISAAFRGEYDSLQAVIPNINAARVESEALAATGKKSAKSLTAQEKAAAVLAIVQKDGARAMGDFARTSDGVANKSKILAARVEDAKAKFGALLLPVRSLVIDGFMRMLDFLPRLGPMFSRVGAFFAPVVAKLRDFFAALGSGVGAGPLADLLSWLRGTFLPGVLAVVESLRGWYAQAFAIVSQFVAGMMTRLAPLMPTVRSIFSTIGQIVSGTMQLVQAVIQRVTQLVGLIWSNWGGHIMSITSSLISGVLGIIRPGLEMVRGIVQLVLSLVKGDWSGAWSALKLIASSALGLIKGIVSGAMGLLRSILSAAMDAARAIFSRGWSLIKSAASSGASAVLDVVRGIPGRVTSALGSLGSLLWSKGAELIQGLIDGIMSKVHAIGDAMGSIASKIKGFLPGSPVKEGPLTSWNGGGAGKRLGGLLADGLDASRATVAAASARMASSVQLGAKVPAFAGAPGQMGTEGASGPSQPLVVNLVLPDGRVLGRTVIDDISGRRRRP